jgi:hypothetical protein
MTNYLSLYDFLYYENNVFDKWQYEDDICNILRICIHIRYYYKLDEDMYKNCNSHDAILIRRIKRSLREIVTFRWNITENFKKVLSDIVFLNTRKKM